MIIRRLELTWCACKTLGSQASAPWRLLPLIALGLANYGVYELAFTSTDV